MKSRLVGMGFGYEGIPHQAEFDTLRRLAGRTGGVAGQLVPISASHYSLLPERQYRFRNSNRYNEHFSEMIIKVTSIGRESSSDTLRKIFNDGCEILNGNLEKKQRGKSIRIEFSLVRRLSKC